MSTHQTNLEYTHLLFRPSPKEGEGVLTARVKTYVQENGRPKHVGERIVVAKKGSGVKRKGRWDVKVKKISNKRYEVVDARWSVDELTIDRREKTFVVQVMVNGKEDRLICEDGAILPLAFSCKKYVDPEEIADYIRRKAAYLQPRADWDVEQFVAGFVNASYRMYQLYEQTTIAKTTAATEDSRKIDVTGLMSKYGK